VARHPVSSNGETAPPASWKHELAALVYEPGGKITKRGKGWHPKGN
jgi:hypothetical protein